MGKGLAQEVKGATKVDAEDEVDMGKGEAFAVAVEDLEKGLDEEFEGD